MKQGSVRLVVCAGSYRSGSTWQYNAARRIWATIAAPARVWAGWVADYSPPPEADIHVVKMHVPALLSEATVEQCHIITCYRDLRSVVVSMLRMGLLVPDRSNIVSWVDHYILLLEGWERIGANVFRYEDMMRDPIATLSVLARCIGAEIDQNQARSIAKWMDTLSPPGLAPTGHSMAYDRETLLHPGHIRRDVSTDIYSEPDAVIMRELVDRYSDWLMAHGYEV